MIGQKMFLKILYGEQFAADLHRVGTYLETSGEYVIRGLRNMDGSFDVKTVVEFVIARFDQDIARKKSTNWRDYGDYYMTVRSQTLRGCNLPDSTIEAMERIGANAAARVQKVPHLTHGGKLNRNLIIAAAVRHFLLAQKIA